MNCELTQRIAGEEWIVHYFDEVDSTSTLLLSWEEAPHGTVILAGSQTAGRGRLGRKFDSPQGSGLYMSLLLRDKIPDSRLTLAAGLAEAWTLEELCGLEIQIKWPNDVLAQGRKLGGILTESRLGSTVRTIVGIGINLRRQLEDFPEEIRHKAGSIAMCGGVVPPMEELAGTLLKNLTLAFRMLEEQPAQVMEGCRKRLYGIGKQVVYGQDPVPGEVLGLGEDGCLIISTEHGVISVGSGEIHIRGLY